MLDTLSIFNEPEEMRRMLTGFVSFLMSLTQNKIVLEKFYDLSDFHPRIEAQFEIRDDHKIVVGGRGLSPRSKSIDVSWNPTCKMTLKKCFRPTLTKK